MSEQNEIVESLNLWFESISESNPIFDIYKSLISGEISYRDYLKNIAHLVNHFCDAMGFVPNESLVRIVQDKLSMEGTGNIQSQAVSTLLTGIRRLPSAASEDDYI